MSKPYYFFRASCLDFSMHFAFSRPLSERHASRGCGFLTREDSEDEAIGSDDVLPGPPFRISIIVLWFCHSHAALSLPESRAQLGRLMAGAVSSWTVVCVSWPPVFCHSMNALWFPHSHAALSLPESRAQDCCTGPLSAKATEADTRLTKTMLAAIDRRMECRGRGWSGSLRQHLLSLQ